MLSAWIFGSGNNIGRRLIIQTIAFSSAITLCTTAVQLLFDYREQRGAMIQELEEVTVYVPNIAGSVWGYDEGQIKLALEALARLPDIVRVSITTTDKRAHWSLGNSKSTAVEARIYPLIYKSRGRDQEIAKLEVVATMDAIYQRLIEHALSSLIGNAVKTFFVAAFMVALFRRLVTRRLVALAHDVREQVPLILPTGLVDQIGATATTIKPDPAPKHMDELDALRWTFAQMIGQLELALDALHMSYSELHQENQERRRAEQEVLDLNATLESRVEQRTQELKKANAEVSATLDALKATQVELLRAEKLAALGSLVAGVAHELNTPVGNGLMVATALNDQTGDFQRALQNGIKRSTLDEYLNAVHYASDIVIRNLRRAADLVASFKQVAADQTRSERRRFNLQEVVSETLAKMAPALRMTEHQFKTDIDPTLELDSYPGPLEQVLTNLINNAMHHGFERIFQGKLSIAARALDGRMIVITVDDDGCGIPAELHGRIFDPFFTTKLGRGGTGLGLNIVHNIVTGILGGKIDVKSESGNGCTFTIVMPRVAPGANITHAHTHGE